MSGWPPIDEPLLRERLAMDDRAFEVFMGELLGALPARPFGPEALKTAFAYPWERPARSYLLTGDTVALLDELSPSRRAVLLRDRAAGPDGATRYPLLAVGSNGAPSTLIRKVAHLPEPERELLVLAGELHDFDVGAAAHPSAYGAMPATLFESPGTAVRAAVLWVSAAQLTQLTWTELSYRFGRLAGVRFAPDQATEGPGELFAYVSRWGTFCPDGAPAALAAIPASGRLAPALTQTELLGHAARLALGPGVSAEHLVRMLFEDMAAFSGEPGARVRATGRPLTAAGWTPWVPEG